MFLRIVAFIVFVVIIAFIVLHSASVLVANDPVPSDVILVLAGADEDSRFRRAVELMEKGYAPGIILDVQAPITRFGVSDTDLAQIGRAHV